MDRVQGRDKYYPKDLIPLLIKTVKIVVGEKFGENVTKRAKKQELLKRNFNL